MSGSQLAGRRWWLRGYLAGRPQLGGSPIHSMVGPPQGLPRPHQHSQSAAGSSEAMEETDSTEVKYKIRQWSLPGATIVPVLNVSSRVFWLELDDKALLDSYSVLQEGILCDVFSQKCSAAWQGARGERLTVGIMLPGRQDADDWLNLYNSGHSHWGDLWTGLQQRAAQAAGQASVDGCQATVGGACWPNVRQSPHREVQKRTGCSALRQGRQTQPHWPIWREKVSWVWNQRSPGMVEEMPGLDGTI